VNLSTGRRTSAPAGRPATLSAYPRSEGEEDMALSKKLKYRPSVDLLESREVLSTSGTPDLATLVLAYAESHLGPQVGDGQSATLAIQALQSAGAQSDFGVWGPWANYVWGTLVLAETGHGRGGVPAVGSPFAVEPGDVVQFSNARFVGGGSWQALLHHTAIIE